MTLAPIVPETWRRVWGAEKFFADQDDVFPEKMSISDDLFFSHRPGFLNFPSLFPDVVHNPFLTRKTPFLLCSYFRAHPTTLLLKILGGERMHGPFPHLKLWGDRSPVP